jgi:hypothetical protein
MAKLSAPYLARRSNRDGTLRWYFRPRTQDKKHGWATVHPHKEVNALIELNASSRWITLF